MEGQSNFWIVAQSFNCVQLFLTPWNATCQPFLSFTISQSLFKLMSIELVMASNHLIILLPSLVFNLSQHQVLSQSIGSLHKVPPNPEKKIKYFTISIFSPSICHEVMGLDAMIFIIGMLSFKPAFSLSSFTFIKRLFRTFLFFATRVVSSAYISLLIFLPPILISAYDSSSLAFHMI